MEQYDTLTASALSESRRLEERNVELLGEMVQTSNEMRDIGHAVHTELNSQSERVRNTIRTMEFTQEKVDRSETIAKNMRSPFSFFTNLFSKKKKKSKEQPGVLVASSILTSVPAPELVDNDSIEGFDPVDSAQEFASSVKIAGREAELLEELNQSLDDVKEGALAIGREVQRSNQDLQTLTKLVDNSNDGLRRARMHIRKI